MRISVELVLSLLALGETAQSVLTYYPELESETSTHVLPTLMRWPLLTLFAPNLRIVLQRSISLAPPTSFPRASYRPTAFATTLTLRYFRIHAGEPNLPEGGRPLV